MARKRPDGQHSPTAVARNDGTASGAAGFRVCGLDIATNTGVAHSDGTLEKWRLNVIVPGAHPGAKLLALARKLEEFHSSRPFDYLAVELSAMGASNNGMVAAFHSEMLGVAKAFAAQRKVVIMKPFNISTIKKFATGYGRAEKADMVRAAHLQGMDVGCDDDLADAFFVLRLAQQTLRNSRLYGVDNGRRKDDRSK